jgi:hypothetical protein
MPPNSLQQQATNLVRTRIDTNSGVSSTTNHLLAVLDGAYDSLYFRDRVDHLLNEYSGGLDEANWKILRSLTSMKDKFAFTI